jgi:hypothetical protein
MRLNRTIWLKLASRGKPQDTQIIEVTARQAALEIGRFIAEKHLHSRFDFTIATERDMLDKTTAANDMELDLESLLDGDYGSDD